MQFLYYHFYKLFSKKEIKDINKNIIKYSNPKFSDGPADAVLKKCNVHISEWTFVKNFLYKAEQISSDTNQKIFGFDIDPIHDLNLIFHNEYTDKENGQYQYHFDGEKMDKMFTMKLTCIINTSEKPYEGGQFILNTGIETHINVLDEPGSMLIFPSFLLHKVCPVTKGKRTSIALWRYGKHWR